MAAGDPILVNLPNATFLLNAETGAIVQSEDRSIDSKWKDVWSQAAGDYIGFVAYAFAASQDFNAIVNGTTGLSAAQPGVVLALANDLGIGSAKNGVAAGGLFTKGVKISHQAEDLRMVSGNTIQRANIPVPS